MLDPKYWYKYGNKILEQNWNQILEQKWDSNSGESKLNIFLGIYDWKPTEGSYDVCIFKIQTSILSINFMLFDF